MLVRLVYASQAKKDIDQQTIGDILKNAKESNLEYGITGVLCAYLGDDRFLQVIEGSRAEVNQLYSNILGDKRHQRVTLLDYAEISVRQFASWRMGGVDLAKVNVSSMLRYSEKPKLDPLALTGASALALLHDLVSSASITSFSD